MNTMKTIKILLVDDDPHMQRLISIFLKKNPFELDKTGNGRIALRKIETQTYDLIISDLQMPETDGIELIKRIRAKNRTTPIIIISAYGLDSMAEEAIKEGASFVLPKPFEAAELLQTIEKVFHKTNKDNT